MDIGGGGGDGAHYHEVRRGRVKWFNVAKGWGFLKPYDGDVEVFVHQTAINKSGFRSLGENEEVEFISKLSDKGVEATFVTGVGGTEVRGSDRRPMSRKKFRKIRCYNCGNFANHIAAKCPLGPQPKTCHNCKAEDHLIADCPKRDPTLTSSLLPRRGGGRNGGRNGSAEHAFNGSSSLGGAAAGGM